MTQSGEGHEAAVCGRGWREERIKEIMFTRQRLQDICPPWSHPRVLVYPEFHALNIKEIDGRGEQGIWVNVCLECVAKQYGLQRHFSNCETLCNLSFQSFHLDICESHQNPTLVWSTIPEGPAWEFRGGGSLPSPQPKLQRAGCQVLLSSFQRSLHFQVWSRFYQLLPCDRFSAGSFHCYIVISSQQQSL